MPASIQCPKQQQHGRLITIRQPRHATDSLVREVVYRFEKAQPRIPNQRTKSKSYYLIIFTRSSFHHGHQPMPTRAGETIEAISPASQQTTYPSQYSHQRSRRPRHRALCRHKTDKKECVAWRTGSAPSPKTSTGGPDNYEWPRSAIYSFLSTSTIV